MIQIIFATNPLFFSSPRQTPKFNHIGGLIVGMLTLTRFNILAVRWVFKNTGCDVTFVWSNFFLFLGWGFIIKTVRKLKQRHQRSFIELKLISFLILMQPS